MINNFGRGNIKDYIRNPLGIVALFISLIYGLATFLLSSTAVDLTVIERWPLIIFIVIFPAIVLFAFYRLVTNHHDKLYAPQDYRDDSSFLQTRIQKNVIKMNNDSGLNGERFLAFSKFMKDFKVVTDNEVKIKADLSSNNIDFSNEVSEMLITQLAASKAMTWFEYLYNSIFGGQIRLLRKLSDLNEGLDIDDVNRHVAEIRDMYESLRSVSDETYLSFMFDYELIDLDGRKIKITYQGKEFLTLLTQSEYNEDKIL